MIIGYNENTVLAHYYSNCSSFMEAAVSVFQETRIEEDLLCQYINESVDIKEAKNKIVSFIGKWLSKILGLINKAKQIVLGKLANKNDQHKKSSENKERKFSIEDYDYSKITEVALKSFHLIGSDEKYPNSAESGEYESYVQNKIKDWTGKDSRMSCTSGEIKTHILDKYCGGKKITITEKTSGYNLEDSDVSKLNSFLKELETAAKGIAKTLEGNINNTKEYGFDFAETSEDVEIVNKEIVGYVEACTKYTSLNTTLISALIDVVIGKANLYRKIL